MKDVYDAIQAKIKATVPQAKTVERYYGQLAMTAAGMGNLIIFPAIYYQLVGIRATTRSKGVQDCQGILRLRHCDTALVVSQLRTLALEEASYFGLSGFRGDPLQVGLDRSAIYPDDNFRGTEVIITEYPIKWTDVTLINQQLTIIQGGQLDAEPTIGPPIFGALQPSQT
ncbi:MAG: hypothetical protein V4621_08225 [Pseudomonadota bacterium]